MQKTEDATHDAAVSHWRDRTFGFPGEDKGAAITGLLYLQNWVYGLPSTASLVRTHKMGAMVLCNKTDCVENPWFSSKFFYVLLSRKPVKYTHAEHPQL